LENPLTKAKKKQRRDVQKGGRASSVLLLAYAFPYSIEQRVLWWVLVD
jgi:hypothetical protein